MKATFTFILLFFFFVSVAFVPNVFAEEGQVSLNDFPQQLANAFDTSLFVGQLLATVILLCFVEFPTLMLSKGNLILAIIVGMPTMGVAVAAGWLPIWIMLVVCLLIAVLFADKMRGFITGRG